MPAGGVAIGAAPTPPVNQSQRLCGCLLCHRPSLQCWRPVGLDRRQGLGRAPAGVSAGRLEACARVPEAAPSPRARLVLAAVGRAR
ncbi:hypothetical protein NDU88_003295 [Pleurodeles waltl]|uniref:Uncharacterized protein n=1 Tax=Pleurodeles waltl TaxID=8319 RepID=A0AAV7M6J5_PLEWA|nr:hypothetical protein NDU88_003295 [Pleurodeles waltl]